MSGIFGIWRKDGSGQVGPALRLMSTGCAVRQSEIVSTAAVNEGAGVGVASCFDGQQIHEDSTTLLVCDADLFNEPELRGLVNIAPEASTATLLAALYNRLGTAFLNRLRGDFSLILWDRVKRSLFAATDCFGIHPLVYYEDSRVLLVASRIEAVLASGDVPRDINVRAVATYLNYTVNLAPETIFTKVMRLLPGYYLSTSIGGITATHQYWDMRYEPNRHATEEELASSLEAVVEDAVRSHVKPGENFNSIGAFLSGGTDSSTVVGMMSRLDRGPARTFSIGFDEERFNELEYARITAKAFNADHNEYLVTAADCADAIPEMVRYFDEPFGNSSAIPTYFCARLAAQMGVRVLLAGDGGDELFGGNERYLTDRIFGAYRNVPGFLRGGFIEPLLKVVPGKNGYVGMARSYVRRASLPQPHRFFSYNLVVDNPAQEIFEPDFVSGLGNFSVLDRPSFYYSEGPAREDLDRLLYMDVKMTLGDNDLLKVTRMSEMAGIKTRFPFLDRNVAEMSGSIPAGLKVKGTQKRYLFKRAFRNLLPSEVIQKKKHGFGIPVATWMKSDKRMKELTADMLLTSRIYERGMIRRSFIETLLRHHESDSTPFYGDTLWTFLALELWFRQFVDVPRKAAA